MSSSKGKAPHKPRYAAVTPRPNWMPPRPLPRFYWEGWHWNNREWWWHPPRADWEQPLPPISYENALRMTFPMAEESSSSAPAVPVTPPPPPRRLPTPPPPLAPDALYDLAWDLTQSLNDTTPPPIRPTRPTFQLTIRAGPPAESLFASQTSGKRKREEGDEGEWKGKGKGKERGK